MLSEHDAQNHSPSIPKLLGSTWVVAAKHIAVLSATPPLPSSVSKWVVGGESQFLHSFTHPLTRSIRVVQTFEALGSYQPFSQ